MSDAGLLHAVFIAGAWLFATAALLSDSVRGRFALFAFIIAIIISVSVL